MRTRPGRVEPEIYFRIVHVTGDGCHGVPVADYLEQTVEIALGPKGAFESGDIGAATRQVAANHVARACRPRGAKPPVESKTPRVTELLRKASEWRRQTETGEVRTRADIARREGITRARVTQVMGMLRLAPGIQEEILSMPNNAHRKPVTERWFRRIAVISDHSSQLQEFHNFLMEH